MSDGVDTSELKKLIEDGKKGGIALALSARKTLRGISFSVEKQIKITMPKDTGRARASWGHWTSGDLTRRAKNASPADAEYSDNGLSIKQGSNVPYIEFLNRGHSQQAPAGFIDMAALKGDIALQEFLGRLDPIDAASQQATVEAAIAWRG